MFELNELLNEVNNMFMENKKERKILLDLLDYQDGYLVLADIPGVKKENIILSFNRDTLSISVNNIEGINKNLKVSERTNYEKRELYIPTSVDYQNASAQYENGVLRVYIPKTNINSKNIIID